MTRAQPWAGLGVLTALAAGVALARVEPVAPPRLHIAAGVLLGAVAGAVLGLAVARWLSRSIRRPPVGVAFFLLAVAAGEEIVWRGGVQAVLTGPLQSWAALVLAALLFGAVHGPSRHAATLHALTGFAFGVVYLATGRLIAAVAAHGAYNIAVLSCDGPAAG